MRQNDRSNGRCRRSTILLSLATAASLFTSLVMAQPPEAQTTGASPIEQINETIATLSAHLQGNVSPRDEPRIGQWMTELAEALLDRLSLDLTDVAILTGEPTSDQLRRTRRDAARAMSLTKSASQALKEAAESIGRRPGLADNRALLDERSRLVVVYLMRRLPMARSRAALLLAAVTNDPDKRFALAREAQRLMDDPDLAEAASLRAQRLQTKAHAAHLLDPHMKSESNRAAELFAAAAADEAATAGVKGEASLALSQLVAASDGRAEAQRRLAASMTQPPFVSDKGVKDPAWTLAGADASVRVELDAAGDPQRKGAGAAAFGDVFAAYERFLDDERLNLSYEQRRAVVFEKLIIAGAGVSDSVAPAILLAARAERAMADTPHAEQASGELRRLAANIQRAIERVQNPLGAAHAESLWAMIRIKRLLLMAPGKDSGDSSAAADAKAFIDLAVRLATIKPHWSRSDEAIEAACALGRQLVHADGESSAESLALWRKALRLRIEQGPAGDRLNEWSCELASLPGAGSGESQSLLEAISPQSPSYARARALLAEHALAKMRSATTPPERRRLAERALIVIDQSSVFMLARRIEALLALDRSGEAVDAAERVIDDATTDASEPEIWRSLTALRAHLRGELRQGGGASQDEQFTTSRLLIRTARLALDWADRTSQPSSRINAVAEDLAGALAASGRLDEAGDVYLSLMARQGRTPALLASLASTRLAAGERVKAFALERELIEHLEAAGLHDDRFWKAWAQLLTILAEENSDGSRSATIERELRRLRALDPALGGEPHRSRLEAIAQRTASR